jgi:hypothetical protein
LAGAPHRAAAPHVEDSRMRTPTALALLILLLVIVVAFGTQLLSA